MAVFLGIDLGTQSLKAMLLDSDRGILNIQQEPYDIVIPELGWAEELPEHWWEALKRSLARMKQDCPMVFSAIETIGFSGQMHGMVALDGANAPVYPAIIWVDQRSHKQVEEIERALPPEILARSLHNRVFTGFGFPSLLWLKEEQPDVFRKVRKICAPKDYLRLRLIGGAPETDTSDASSMNGFDFERRDWNFELLSRFGLDSALFPSCHEATEPAGTVTRQAAEETGLPEGAAVVYGSGDLPAVGMGCGMYKEGMAVVNIGTGATYSCYSDGDIFDPELRMQEFCNAVNRAYILCGAILSGGLSLNWLKNKVLDIPDYAEVNRLAGEVPAGSDGLVFLPYLGGERAPHMDMNASGLFFGLRHMHGRGHFCRAVMEGVTFALKDCDRLMEQNGIRNHTIIASGGGAKSRFWLQLQADILDKEIVVTASEEEACLGACIIAGLGTGIFRSAKEACARFVRFRDRRYTPDARTARFYSERYEIYHALYPQLKELMRKNR